MVKEILIKSATIESEEFVVWLNDNGYSASLTNSECDATKGDFINDLWEKYCCS